MSICACLNAAVIRLPRVALNEVLRYHEHVIPPVVRKPLHIDK